jgi:MoaA/NifB/PqqE/SkfB family radical SAM enzyme
MCPRNIHGGIDNPTLKINDWSYEDFVTIFNQTVLNQISSVIFCGTFGDPILNNNLIKMCQYLNEKAPQIHISIHTNGSARNIQWWKELAKQKVHVVFAIDGLVDTHHLYRIGTDWNKIITNARAFIDEGGDAEWMFIRFKHNEHQVVEAKKLALEFGFNKFTLKNTRRFETAQFPVLNKQGEIDYYLEQPSDQPVKLVNKADLESYNNWSNKCDIDCYALDRSEIYIDACYTLMSCCLLSAFIYTNYDKTLLQKYNIYHNESVVDIGKKIQQQVMDLINNTLGGFDNINVLRRPIQEIIDNKTWQTIWKENWDLGTLTGCAVLCSKDSPYITIDEQWVDNN